MDLKYGPYSPSRLDTASCGYSFIRQYGPDKDQTKPPPSIASERGSAVHEIYEHITAKLLTQPDHVFSAGEVRDLVKDAINRHPAAYDETSAITAMAQGYIRKPPPVLTTDAEIERRLAVKYMGDGQFEECDYDDPQAFARGRADILVISDDTTTAIVYDHKTQPNVEDADTFQMGMYAWMVKKIYPFLQEVRTVLHFARYGRYSDPFVWSADDLARIEDDLMTRVEIIESRESWDATPHKNCQYCPYLTTCPAMAEHIEVTESGEWRVLPQSIKILGNTQKAVQMAGMINVLEELVKRAKDELKEFVKAAGSGIAIPGKKYDFWASDPKVNWDIVNKSLRTETYAIFERHHVDPKNFMGFSQTFTDAVWKLSDKNLLDDLAKTFPKKVETEFRGKKI